MSQAAPDSFTTWIPKLFPFYGLEVTQQQDFHLVTSGVGLVICGVGHFMMWGIPCTVGYGAVSLISTHQVPEACCFPHQL